MIIRPATADDVGALTSLYNDLGVATTASYDLAPVTVAQRREWLDEHALAGWPVLVADDGGAVVGFAAYGGFRPKPGYNLTVEHSVYVAGGHQGQGTGQMLMTSLIGIARARGVHAMVGVVDADNAASIGFHERIGFRTCGVLPEVGRKFGRWLDVAFQVLILTNNEREDAHEAA